MSSRHSKFNQRQDSLIYKKQVFQLEVEPPNFYIISLCVLSTGVLWTAPLLQRSPMDCVKVTICRRQIKILRREKYLPKAITAN